MAERSVAQELIHELAQKPAFKGKLTTEVIAWDDPLASAPMDATRTPQESVNRYSGRPAECDLTIVLLWTRLGTPLPVAYCRADGSHYESGTVWELEDAQRAGKPVWVYRRTEEPLIKLKDPARDAKLAAFEEVDAFMTTFSNSDGTIARGCNVYADIQDLRTQLAQHLEVFARAQLEVAALAVQRPLQLPPPATVGELLGRTRERKDLRALLARGKNAAVIGPAGIGKTALAAAALRDVVGESSSSLAASPFPDGVVFLDLYQLRARLNDVFNALANALIAGAHADRPALDRATYACRNKQLLVIFEGAEEADGLDGRATLADLHAVLDSGNRRLILSRNVTHSLPGHTVKLDDALGSSEAAELLDRLTDRILPDETRSDILKLLEGHPLALTWAGGLLARRDEDPSYLADSWQREHLPSLSDPDPARREHTLEWLFSRNVRSLNLDEQTALAAASLLASAPFPLSAIEAALPLDADHSERGRARASLQRLVRAGLLRLTPDSKHWEFSHALAYRFARHHTGEKNELLQLLAAWLHQHLMTGMHDALDTLPPTWLSHQLLHIEALARRDVAHLLWRPLVEDTLYDIRERLAELGRLEYALRAIRIARDWIEQLSPDAANAPDWIRERGTALHELGRVQREQGDLAGALQAYEQGRVIAAQLVAADPSNAQWQRDLSISVNHFGPTRIGSAISRSASTISAVCSARKATWRAPFRAASRAESSARSWRRRTRATRSGSVTFRLR